MSVKILWIQHAFNGPLNGLAEYKGEKVWFRKVENSESELISSKYELVKLSEDDLKKVEDNHIRYCKELNLPLHYGYEAKPTKPVKMISRDKEKGTGKIRVLTENAKIFTHSFVCSDLKGEVVALIKDEEFSNFNIPRKV